MKFFKHILHVIRRAGTILELVPTSKHDVHISKKSIHQSLKEDSQKVASDFSAAYGMLREDLVNLKGERTVCEQEQQYGYSFKPHRANNRS